MNNEIWKKYRELHTTCPLCRDPEAEIESQTMGCLAPPDTNKATCLMCGWVGKVDDLIPNTNIELDKIKTLESRVDNLTETLRLLICYIAVDLGATNVKHLVEKLETEDFTAFKNKNDLL